MNARTRAGSSAREHHARARASRYARHRAKWGLLAPITARIAGESENEERWRIGAEGEERTGKRLDSLLGRHSVDVLHDLCVPGSRANIDHVCVGPGGVTVIDSKNRRGRLRLERGELWLGDYRRPELAGGVLKQVAVVEAVLEGAGLGDLDVRGALCWLRNQGLPGLGTISAQGVLIGGPRQIAKLARREPAGPAVDVDVVSELIGRELGRGAAVYSGVSANGSSVSRELDTSTK